jgi:hypothetical protein
MGSLVPYSLLIDRETVAQRRKTTHLKSPSQPEADLGSKPGLLTSGQYLLTALAAEVISPEPNLCIKATFPFTPTSCVQSSGPWTWQESWAFGVVPKGTFNTPNSFHVAELGWLLLLSEELNAREGEK